VIKRNYSYLRKKFGEVDEEARNIFERLSTYSKVDEGELIEACKLYLALKKIVSENNALGITLDCLAEKFEGKYGLIHPCLAYSLLLDEKISCSCEGDTLTLITLVLLNKFFEEPCFMTNILPLSLFSEVSRKLEVPLSKYDKAKTVILGHCSYLGPVPLSITSKLVIRKKYDKIHKSGVTVDAEIREGPITLVKFSPLFRKIQVIKGFLRKIDRYSSLHAKSIAVVEVEDSYRIAEKYFLIM